MENWTDVDHLKGMLSGPLFERDCWMGANNALRWLNKGKINVLYCMDMISIGVRSFKGLSQEQYHFVGPCAHRG